MSGRDLVGWDVGPAVAVALVQVVGARAANLQQTGVRSLDLFGYLLLLAGPVALLFRRYRPLSVLLVALGVCIAFVFLDYGYGPVFLSLIVAFLTAGVHGPRRFGYPLIPLGYLLLVWPVPALFGRPVGVWQAIGLMAWLMVLVGMAEGIRQRRAVLEARRQRAEAARRSAQAQRRRRASEERLAIARELHDVLAHSLSLINVQSSVALELFHTKPQQAATALAAIKSTSKDALVDVHALLQAIRSGAPVDGTADADDDRSWETDDRSDPASEPASGRGRLFGKRPYREERSSRDRSRRRDTDGHAADAGDNGPTGRRLVAVPDPVPGLAPGPARGGVNRPAPGPAPRSPAPSIADLDELLRHSRTAGLSVHTKVLGDARPLPSVIDMTAARIIQESLTNVLRHAPGVEATVTVRYSTESVDLTIDNTRPAGKSERSGSGGNGIIGMRERAHALGGALTAGPRPSGGFRVAARLPSRPLGVIDTSGPTGGAPGRDTGEAGSAAGGAESTEGDTRGADGVDMLSAGHDTGAVPADTDPRDAEVR
ncbi:sensor histidine kinase [Nocardia brevicatena]|uniref:sensor histidine kinase n=1 Tax=Nocardia brevicatena TaxID=37327 RepID=UPI00030CCE52|nr:histidine kinase [Nocardia brevicatena]